jgi:hypothetical protein
MQRLACLLIGITAAACGGGGTDSGPADLMGTIPPGKSVGARTFAGKEGNGMDVLGWKLEFFEQGPGADCLSTDTKVVARIGIYTNQPNDKSKPNAILALGDIPIVTTSPPPVNGQAAATMSAEGVNGINGIVTITEFHLEADAMHADRIKGTVSAGGMDGTGNPIAVTGSFDAPFCPE